MLSFDDSHGISDLLIHKVFKNSHIRWNLLNVGIQLLLFFSLLDFYALNLILKCLEPVSHYGSLISDKIDNIGILLLNQFFHLSFNLIFCIFIELKPESIEIKIWHLLSLSISFSTLLIRVIRGIKGWITIPLFIVLLSLYIVIIFFLIYWMATTIMVMQLHRFFFHVIDFNMLFLSFHFSYQALLKLTKLILLGLLSKFTHHLSPQILR